MIDNDMLYLAMRRKKITGIEAANALGIDYSTFFRKQTRQQNTFTVEEAGKLARLLELNGEEASRIFFYEPTCTDASKTEAE